jgi:hypothetical protein
MNCRVCGRQFDPQGFQVMVPGLKHGFDRVDCALEASAVGVPPPRSVEPSPAVVRALPPSTAAMPALAGGPPTVVQAESVRPQLLTGANLALLAAGTAATIYLWLRVFGADIGPFSFPAANASEAFGTTAVPASIDLSQPVSLRQPANIVRGLLVAQPATSSTSGGGGSLASNRSDKKQKRDDGQRQGRGGGGPAVRPTPPAPPPAPPSEPTPTRSAPAPTYPVPSSPPDDRIPGPAPPGGSNPEQPALPGAGDRP